MVRFMDTGRYSSPLESVMMKQKISVKKKIVSYNPKMLFDIYFQIFDRFKYSHFIAIKCSYPFRNIYPISLVFISFLAFFLLSTPTYQHCYISDTILFYVTIATAD